MITIKIPKELLQEGQKSIEPRCTMSKEDFDDLYYYVGRDDEGYAYCIPLKEYAKMSEEERNDFANAKKIKVEGHLSI